MVATKHTPHLPFTPLPSLNRGWVGRLHEITSLRCNVVKSARHAHAHRKRAHIDKYIQCTQTAHIHMCTIIHKSDHSIYSCLALLGIPWDYRWTKWDTLWHKSLQYHDLGDHIHHNHHPPSPSSLWSPPIVGIEPSTTLLITFHTGDEQICMCLEFFRYYKLKYWFSSFAAFKIFVSVVPLWETLASANQVWYLTLFDKFPRRVGKCQDVFSIVLSWKS